jgi:PAS domain S-box-containing protein
MPPKPLNKMKKQKSNLLQTKAALRESEKRFKELAELLPQTVYEMDLNGNLTFVNKKAFDHFGYAQEDFDQGANAFDMIVPEEHERAIKNISELVNNGKIGSNIYLALRKDKSTFPAQFYSEAIFRNGKPAGVRGIIIDITKQTTLEEELRKARDELELRVKERTLKLMQTNKKLTEQISERKRVEKKLLTKEKELKNKNTELQEFNTALKVLLKQRDKDREQLGENIIRNVKELVLPYLEKVKKDKNKCNQTVYFDIIESNLRDIISPFGANLKKKYYNLTPAEIRIADFIKHGKTTKEIADILNLSPKTVEYHRDNIRTKFQIKNKKISLRTHLISLQ